MVDEISSELPDQMVTPPNNTVFDKNNENEKPEKSDYGVSETKTKNVIEDGKLVVEQYDKHGKLIRRTPPGYLAPGEKV
jgi:hypothetical protein